MVKQDIIRQRKLKKTTFLIESESNSNVEDSKVYQDIMTLIQKEKRYKQFLTLFRSLPDELWENIVKIATDKLITFDNLNFYLLLTLKGDFNREALTELVRDIMGKLVFLNVHVFSYFCVKVF